jgi:hypothetical protein
MFQPFEVHGESSVVGQKMLGASTSTTGRTNTVPRQHVRPEARHREAVKTGLENTLFRRFSGFFSLARLLPAFSLSTAGIAGPVSGRGEVHDFVYDTEARTPVGADEQGQGKTPVGGLHLAMSRCRTRTGKRSLRTSFASASAIITDRCLPPVQPMAIVR